MIDFAEGPGNRLLVSEHTIVSMEGGHLGEVLGSPVARDSRFGSLTGNSDLLPIDSQSSLLLRQFQGQSAANLPPQPSLTEDILRTEYLVANCFRGPKTGPWRKEKMEKAILVAFPTVH
jgi:hypothetical protein